MSIIRHYLSGEDYITFCLAFGIRIRWEEIGCPEKVISGIPFEVVRENVDKVDWTTACEERLPEDFLREFADYLDWGAVPAYSRLSEDFIRDYRDRLDWEKYHPIKNSQRTSL